MRVPGTVRWVALALLGILIAAGVSVAASRLASQQIGLASEPITAGDALAPANREPRARHRPPRRHRLAHPKPTAPSPPREARSQPVSPSPPASPSPPGDDGGRVGGDGEPGRDADD
jgi:hypothetical protein